LPDPYLDKDTGEPVSAELQERYAPRSIAAQEFSLERWIGIPQPVLDAYRLWRPTPLMRARALERALGTPAEIWFKYEGASPSGQPQAQRGAGAGALREERRRQAAGDGPRRRPVGFRARDRRRARGHRGARLHGPSELRPEALPPLPDGDIRRDGAAEPR